MREKNDTSRWCCLGSSTIARSNASEKMSRTTRTERSASWKTSEGADALLDALVQDLVELEQVQQLALEVGALGAVRRGADDRAGALEVELGGLLAQALALLVVEPAGDADALAVGGEDHVAPGDREVHREPGALRLQRVLDDLHDDLLPGLEHLGDLPAVAALAATAARRLDAGEHDLVDVQEPVLLEADVDEGGLEAGEDVVDAALVDVADDRAGAAALEVELGDVVAGSGVGGLTPAARGARAGLAGRDGADRL